mmetsp:Transcript_28555/g.55001  ORF Transcript_28555/g.55001 Transcript_28555/m.55001 type:complete len:437 (+) Transcript_28555:61-1371(+)
MALSASKNELSSVEIFRGNLCKQIFALEAKLVGRIDEVEACLQRQRHTLDGRIYELERGLARMQVLQDATTASLGDERMELLLRHVDQLENELKDSRLLGGKLLGHLTQQVKRLDSEVTGVQRIQEIPDPLVLDEEGLKKRMDALESNVGEAFSRLGMPMAAGKACSTGAAEFQEETAVLVASSDARDGAALNQMQESMVQDCLAKAKDFLTAEEPRETMAGGVCQHASEAASEQPEISKEVSKVDECVARLRLIAAGMRSSHDEGKDAMDKLSNASMDDSGMFAHLPAKVAAIVASAPLAESSGARRSSLAVTSDDDGTLQTKSAEHEERNLRHDLSTWALSARPGSSSSAGSVGSAGVPQPTPRDEAGVAHSWLHTASVLTASTQRQLAFNSKIGKEEGQTRISSPKHLPRSVSVRPPPTPVEGPRVLPRQQQQ